MSTEFELKLEVPADRVQPLAAALRAGGAVRERLRATYFDTPDGALAAHGVVVRMRQEGRKWVQTAKAPGEGPLHRLEHNVPVEPEAAAGSRRRWTWRATATHRWATRSGARSR